MKNKLKVSEIADKLRKSPSYLRWSDLRIANKYGCALRTAKVLKNQLVGVKSEYNKSIRIKSRNQNQPA